VSNFWKFTFVMAVACGSALISAQTVVLMAKQAPVFRAASVQAAVSAARVQAEAPIVDDAPYRGPHSSRRARSAQSESTVAGNPATVPRGRDGHYWAVGDVNGANVRFLIDTGATTSASTWPRSAIPTG
jgi:predicted aspartyl protease